MKYTYIDGKPCAREILNDLVATVNAAGGIKCDDHGVPCPVCDPEWIDLGYTYLSACKFLGVEPMEENRDE